MLISLRTSLATIGCTIFLTLPGLSHAQGWYGGDIERGLRPGPLESPRAGMSWNEWYSYSISPQFYINLDVCRFQRELCVDQQYRAATIGLKYQSPANPCGKVPLFNKLLGQTAIEVPGVYGQPYPAGMPGMLVPGTPQPQMEQIQQPPTLVPPGGTAAPQ